MKKNQVLLVGHIGVDAGICWIGDPCYIMHKNTNEIPRELGRSWGEFCDNLFEKENDSEVGAQFNYDMGHEGLGVCVPTGFGDGVYPVYAELSDEGDWGKRVKKVWIEFIPDENEEIF